MLVVAAKRIVQLGQIEGFSLSILHRRWLCGDARCAGIFMMMQKKERSSRIFPMIGVALSAMLLKMLS